MEKDRTKILIALDDDLLKRIDDYRFDNRINSRAAAIRELIASRLEELKIKPKKK